MTIEPNLNCRLPMWCTFTDKDFQNKRSRMEQHNAFERGDAKGTKETASKSKDGKL